MKDKFKNWIQEHKKEIKLVTIGGVAGVSNCLLGRKFYEDIYLSNRIATDVVNKNGRVGIRYRRYNLFGKMMRKKYIIEWDPETTKTVIEDLENAVKKC